jgi:hypothetical protein
MSLTCMEKGRNDTPEKAPCDYDVYFFGGDAIVHK